MDDSPNDLHLPRMQRADSESLKLGVSNFGALEQRVTFIEERLDELRVDIKDLNTTIRDLDRTILMAHKPNYQVWAGMGGLMIMGIGSLWGLAIQPLNNSINVLSASIIPPGVLTERQMDTDKALARMEADIKSKASQEELKRVTVDMDQRLPRAK